MLLSTITSFASPKSNLPERLLQEVYCFQGRLSEAEPLYLQALEMDKNLWGKDHPNVAIDLNNLAGLYESKGLYSEAESFYLQAVEISAQQLGTHHPNTIRFRKNFAMLRDRLKSIEKDLPTFKQKAKKGNSKQKPKGFGKV